MKLFAKVENICAAALILAFFLPWVSIGGLFTIPGYKIPDIVQALSGLGSSLAEMGNQTGQASQGTPAVTYAIYGLYLIPILAVYFLVRAGTGKSTKGVGLAAGLLPVAAFAVALAAKEYRVGVPGPPGQVTSAAEVDEARQFIEQARFDVPFLPRAARAAADSGLGRLVALFAAAAAADSVERVANDVADRIARTAGGAIVPLPTRPPSPARGAQVYREQCANCHGDQGRGD